MDKRLEQSDPHALPRLPRAVKTRPSKPEHSAVCSSAMLTWWTYQGSTYQPRKPYQQKDIYLCRDTSKPKHAMRVVVATGCWWQGGAQPCRNCSLFEPGPPCVVQDLETEYAVSPNTPLLSTEVQENAWVCGKRHHASVALQCTHDQGVGLCRAGSCLCAVTDGDQSM